MKFFFILIAFLIIVTTANAITVFDLEFDQQNSGIVTVNSSGLTMQPYNCSNFRLITTDALSTNDFEIIVSGYTAASGSYVNTHVEHYLGIVQKNIAPSNSTERLELGFSNEGTVFNTDTHYRINLNEEVGGNGVSFTVKFIRSGNTITTQKEVSSDVFQTINTYTIKDPESDLFFEFAEADGTSSGAGYSVYQTFNSDVSNVPESTNLILFAAAIFCYFSRKFTIKS